MISACFTEKTVFGSYEDGTIVEWAFNNQGDILNQYLGHTKRVNGLFTMGKHLISGSNDGTIRVWQIGVRIHIFRMAKLRQCIRQVEL